MRSYTRTTMSSPHHCPRYDTSRGNTILRMNSHLYIKFVAAYVLPLFSYELRNGPAEETSARSMVAFVGDVQYEQPALTA